MCGEEEIFEITDFTVVTDWERFIEKLESLLHEWHLTGNTMSATLPKGALHSAKWREKREQITFSALNLRVVLWQLEIEEKETNEKDDSSFSHVPPILMNLLESGSDFCPGVIPRYYGLSQFVLLSPLSKNDAILSENRRNMIISSVLIATSSAECELPIFLQTGEPWRNLFVGVCQNRNIRTNFDMVHLRNCPQKFTNLTGLLDMFREKVVCPLTTPPSVKVSVHLTFELQEKFDTRWTQTLPDFDEEVGISGLTPIDSSGSVHFPFGVCQDPLKSLQLSVTWPNLNEDMLVENDVYSDLDPISAPYWYLSVEFERGLQCLMHDNLLQFVNATRCHTSVDAVLGIEEKSGAESALSRLTKAPVARAIQPLSFPTVSSFDSNSPLPLDQATLDKLLDIVFEKQDNKGQETLDNKQTVTVDDENSGPGRAVKRKKSVEKTVEQKQTKDNISKFQNILQTAKSAPLTSITVRLAGCLCQLLNGPQGLPSVCQLWREFVMHLRYYWEDCELLPGIDHTSSPDLGTCLLHQKLAMLQCCIATKLKRQELNENPTQSSSDEDNDESDFYDCFEDSDDIAVDAEETAIQVAVGRFAPAGDMMLLNKTEHRLFVPITQDPSPMTEDILEERIELLDSLGTTDEGAGIRAKIQSESLLSDMQAFKAANPGCCLEDFVRWHSPRDWIQNDASFGQEKHQGHLSVRMTGPGNLWQETWNNAKAIPISRQKRLFNEAKEAEKILHWLGSLTVSDLATVLLAPLLTATVTQLCREAYQVEELISEKLIAACRKFVNASKHSAIDVYRDLLRDIHWVEASTAQYRALKSRFITDSPPGTELHHAPSVTDIHAFVLALMRSDNQVPIFGAANSQLGHVVKRLFAADARVSEENERQDGRKTVFSAPLKKEYVLRWFVPRPVSVSRPSPQRLYASIEQGVEFRLAGAFSEDVTLF